MIRLLSLTCLFALLFAAQMPVSGQESQPAPDKTEPKPADNGDGYDRPTKYPRIRFKGENIEKVATPDGGSKDVKSRAYLIDLSAAMTASSTLSDGTETTRLARLKSIMTQALESIAKSRDMVFNIGSFGTESVFADDKSPVAVTSDVIDRAKKWIDELAASGDSDLYPLLFALYEQAPTSATLLVGSDPIKPADVSDAAIAAAGTLQDYLVKFVEECRKAGKKTTLDIVGIDLSDTQREFYRRLAKAGGGVYLDG